MGQETVTEEWSSNEDESPNEDAQRFYDMLISANEPIYEGAKVSKLSIAVRLLAAQANWHCPQKFLDYFIQMLVDVAPVNSSIPSNYYQAKKLVAKLGLDYVTIYCCPKGYMLYYKEDSFLKECKICHAKRYKPRKGEMGNYKDIPEKRMFYLPIIPRLQRLVVFIDGECRTNAMAS